MKLPELSQPQRYRGLYVYDFGGWTAVGYTAEEVAVLLESERYRGGTVYKIVRAAPDGQMELRGVAPERFQLESGLFFNRGERTAAEADFETLCRLARHAPPPCRAKVQLADRGQPGPARFVTALIYPAEYEDEVGHWLLDAGYAGGDLAEGGISHVTDWYHEEHEILRRAQLWSAATNPSRSADEVLSSVRQAVQR